MTFPLKYRQEGQNWILALEAGEEIVSTLNAFLAEHNIKGGFLVGLGAVENVELSYYDLKEKKYHSKKFDEGTFELLNLTASVSETGLHAHVTLAGHDFKAFGGHLAKATVAAAFEGFLTPAELICKEHNEEIGLKLMKL